MRVLFLKWDRSCLSRYWYWSSAHRETMKYHWIFQIMGIKVGISEGLSAAIEHV